MEWSSVISGKHGHDEGHTFGLNSWTVAFPRTGNIERLNSVFDDPSPNPLRGRRGIQVDQQVWSSMCASKLEGQRGSRADPTSMQHKCAVGINDIAFRTELVVGRFTLEQLVSRRNQSIFGVPAARTPTAVGEAQRDGRLQCATIHPRLTSGNNFQPRAVHSFAVRRLGSKSHIKLVVASRLAILRCGYEG